MPLAAYHLWSSTRRVPALDSRILVAPLLRFLNVVSIEDEDAAKIALDSL